MTRILRQWTASRRDGMALSSEGGTMEDCHLAPGIRATGLGLEKAGKCPTDVRTRVLPSSFDSVLFAAVCWRWSCSGSA